MPLLREIRARARQIAPQVLLACLAAYFGYHAVQGERGVLAWQRLDRELAEARALDDRLAAEQDRLRRHVNLLRPDNLDPDLLEEQARALLNYGRPDDYVILWPGDGEF